MIVALALVAACLGGACAQPPCPYGNLTNSEYCFSVQSVIDGHAYNNNGDPVPILTMDCLAANGYGQWTLTSTSNSGTGCSYPTGWYLLGNGLYAPSVKYDPIHPTVHPGCIPPGVVQNGDIANGGTPPAQVKAVANLNGWVVYVWASTDRSHFEIREFSSSDIDISLGFLSNPALPMKIVAAPTIHTQTARDNPLVIATESDWRDAFDIAINANNLFIVWKTTTGFLKVDIVPLGLTSYGSITPLFGPGERPTVACDIRSTASNCEMAWLTGHQNPGDLIMRGSCDGSTVTAVHPLLNQYTDPHGCSGPYSWPLHARVLQTSGTDRDPNTAVYAIVRYSGLPADVQPALVFYDPTDPVTVAKFIDGPCPWIPPVGPSPTGTPLPYPPVADAAIVAFADPYDNQVGMSYDNPFHCLYQRNYSYSDPSTAHVQPIIIVKGSNQPIDTRLVLNQDPVTHTLLKNPIGQYVAAVNQMGIHVHWHALDLSNNPTHYYARDMKRTFDEDIEENTLVTDQCTVSDGTSHGGTVGAQILWPEMSIWTDPNYGFSTTDVNSGLYQPIDVTTLNPYVGQLNFFGDNVKLYVGTLSIDNTATLASMPYVYFNFPGSGQGIEVHGHWDYYGRIATHSSRTVQTGLYTPFTNGTASSTGPNSGGIIDIQGSMCGCEAGGYFPGHLIVHGGADFYTGKNGKFIVGPYDGSAFPSGEVDVNDEANLYPLTTGSANPIVTGHLTLLGQTLLTGDGVGMVGGYNGAMFGNIPWDGTNSITVFNSKKTIMTVKSGYVEGSSDKQFYATGFRFENTDHDGLSELDFGSANRTTGSGLSYHWELDGCSFTANQIHLMDPEGSSPFIVDGCTFDQIRGKCVFLDNDQSPANTEYGQLDVSSNDFRQFSSKVFGTYTSPLSGDPPTYVDEPYGVYAKGFDWNAVGRMGDPEMITPKINNNTFTESQFHSELRAQAVSDWSTLGWTNAAIGLENTTSMVVGNTITDNGYPAGISLHAPVPDFSGWYGQPPLSYSVLCSNTIQGMVNTTYDGSVEYFGIIANSLIGPISLNTVTGNEVGIVLRDNSKPNLTYNDLTGNLEIALDVQNGPNGQSIGKMSVDPLAGGYGAYNSLSTQGYDWSESEFCYPIGLEQADLSHPGGIVDIDQGLNNISLTTLNNPSTRTDYYFIFASYTTSWAAIHEIGQNWWGVGTTSPISVTPQPWNTYVWATIGSGNIGVNPNVSWGTALGPHSQSTFSNKNCPHDAGHAPGCTVGKKGVLPLAVPPDSASCANLYLKLQKYSDQQAWQMLYDSGKKFVETCYDDPVVTDVFSDIGNAVGYLQGLDTNLGPKYRQWLESVLYLNTTNPYYFCVCVQQISYTVSGYALASGDTGETLGWKGQNCTLAVLAWLMRNTNCDAQHLLWGEYKATRNSQRESWLNDTTVPYDTTLPPLSSLGGLDTLLAKHFQFAWVPSGGDFGKHVASYSVSENPLHEATTLHFAITDAEYVRVEVFDILGYNTPCPSLQKTGEGLFEPGPHQIPIDFSRCASGTYYLRITLGTGEVRTIKLVKE